MHKIIILGCLAFVGCATTSQVESLTKQLEEEKDRSAQMESRIARIEKDLYSVELKTAPKTETVRAKLTPAQNVSSNVIDTKIKAFLKEYTGYALGDADPSIGATTREEKNAWRMGLEMPKKYQYFDTVKLHTTGGKITGITITHTFDKKYSYNSCAEQMKKSISDLAVTWGLASDYFDSWEEKFARFKNNDEKNLLSKRLQSEAKPGLCIDMHGFNGLRESILRVKGYSFAIAVTDSVLAKEIKNQMNNAGDTLPPVK